jgi:sugar lactone lactonase YvrE
MYRRIVCATFVFALGRLMAAPVTPYDRASVKPSLARLAPGAQQRFKVVIQATRLLAARAAAEVKWSVNDVPGGNAEWGTIDASGLYRAPAKAPLPHEVHICAEIGDAYNRRAWATVLVGSVEAAYKPAGTWGEDKGPAAHLQEPHGISIDLGGNLLIADQGAGRIFRYAKDGRYLGEVGRGPGNGEGQFSQPRFAVVDAAGNIYVTDVKSDKARMQVFDPDGKFLRIFSEKGTAPGMILRGHGIAFDPKGRLFVTDVDNMRVSVFEPSGKFLFCWGKDGLNPGDFNAPHGLYLDPNGDVFVNGYYGPTQKFDSDGRFLFAFAHGDPPDGSVYFHSVAGDRWGDVYVTVRTKAGYSGAIESNRGKKVSIAKYNNSGDFICNISLSVPEHSESWAAVDKDGTIYALFKGRTRAGVEIFRPR